MTVAPEDEGQYLRLYTNGEIFRISNGYDLTYGEDAVILTKEEMQKVLIFFSPYFSNHDFGVDE